jgi:predicted acyltransferase
MTALSMEVLAQAPVRARAERVLALDALRGVTVVGMIAVNAAGFLHSDGGYPAFPALLHSEWAGFSLADAVFPSFIFMVGASIGFSVRDPRALSDDVRAGAYQTLFWRAMRLLALGFVVCNLFWLQTPDGYQARYCGVLQRIGLVYFAAGLLFLATGPRTRAVVAGVLLLAYWPLTLLPFPDGSTRLDATGLNFVSWLERSWLGVHAYVKGPHGYDPEGLLSTLPAIAQALMGVAAAEWMKRRGPTAAAIGTLVLAGLISVALGLAWSGVFPPVKALWTSSFVLISTGPPLILLALFWWLLDAKRIRPPGLDILLAFGANAILAYVIHEVGSVVLEWSGVRAIWSFAARFGRPETATLLPVALFVALVWLPIGALYRRKIFVRI